MTSVSVIIPTHNRRELLLEALASLRQQAYSRGSYEVIVAIDRCTDGTIEALESWKDFVTLSVASRGGKAAALNSGIELARGELALFIDDDMLPAPDFISAHVSAHSAVSQRKSTMTGYSPVVLPFDADSLLQGAARRFAEFHERLAEPDRVPAPTDLNGANFSIRLEHLRDVGGFNEGYFFQRDDFELGARLMEAGFHLGYAPAAQAVQRITITPEEMISRAAPRAENDLRLAAEFPWCICYLPFARAVASRGSRSRWHMLWNAGDVARSMLARAQSSRPGNTRIVGLLYTAEYIATLKRELRSWNKLIQLAGRSA